MIEAAKAAGVSLKASFDPAKETVALDEFEVFEEAVQAWQDKLERAVDNLRSDSLSAGPQAAASSMDTADKHDEREDFKEGRKRGLKGEVTGRLGERRMQL